MKHFATISALIMIISNIISAQDKTWQGPSVDFKHGNLKVSENKHFLVFEDGTPFFYLGDTFPPECRGVAMRTFSRPPG